MSAPTPFDDTPSGDARFYAGLPTKHVAAGWLFQDAAGRVLLVQPAYKDSWEIPGGGVEEGESPGEAARRELRESSASTGSPVLSSASTGVPPSTAHGVTLCGSSSMVASSTRTSPRHSSSTPANCSDGSSSRPMSWDIA
jgi:hypothetical protein